ncbi:restriction endonuclease subunit S [Huintestinicola sp.]|uniref:restriction endonuclease subunit S n=1 Tax=Huintestinicola sp. TaxID=2981661 RepID=UPI003D7EC9C4
MGKWENVKLSDIGKIITGNTPKTSEPENYVSDDIPFIKPSDFSDDSLEICNTEFYIAEAARKKARIIAPETIVVTCIGIIGKTAIIANESAFNQQINAIEVNEKAHNRFVAYAIASQREYLQEFANAAVVPILNKTDFSNIQIPLPPLFEQKKIAATLDKVTDLINLRKKELEKLDLLVKSRFVEMFGDPVENSMNWNRKPMDEVAPSIPYKEKIDGKVWLLNLDMVEPNTGRIIEYFYVDRSEVGNSTSAFDEGNVLYSKLRPYLNKVVIPNCKGYATTELVPLRPNSSLNREFLAFLLRSDSFVSYINEKVAGAKMPRVSMGDFREFKCILPPLNLQTQFANFVKQTDKSKNAVKKSLEKLETLKKALMQEYFG